MSTTEIAIISFATSDPDTARRYLAAEQMDYLTAETKEFILDGVEAGICRVCDPDMYGGGSGIVPETSDRELWDPFIARVRELHDRDFGSRPQPYRLDPASRPDGYAIEWGVELTTDSGDTFISWNEDKHYWEEAAREAERGYMRYVSQPIPLPAAQEDTE